jgi:hypothetical protein
MAVQAKPKPRLTTMQNARNFYAKSRFMLKLRHPFKTPPKEPFLFVQRSTPFWEDRGVDGFLFHNKVAGTLRKIPFQLKLEGVDDFLKNRDGMEIPSMRIDLDMSPDDMFEKMYKILKVAMFVDHEWEPRLTFLEKLMIDSVQQTRIEAILKYRYHYMAVPSDKGFENLLDREIIPPDD